MKSMQYMRKGAKEGSAAEEKGESKAFEKTEDELHEKISKRKVKKMSHNQEKASGKYITNPPKTGKAMKPSEDTSGGAY